MTVSDNQRQLALRFCNLHLPGLWKEVVMNQVDIATVSGGMTNILYRCSLKPTVPVHSNEPKQVLLRIYGPSKGDVTVELEIFNQLAKAGLGPRLISAFEGGRFEEYLASDALKWNEMTDDSVARAMAHKIAAIHKLEVNSLDKRSNWLIDKYREYVSFIESLGDLPIVFGDYIPDSSRKKALNLVSTNFRKDMDFLEETFAKTQKSLVFSHNDLHQNNIVLMHDNSLSLEDRIVLIDFEYSSYNYRTFDIANHLSEYCFDYNQYDEYPYFDFSLDRFPSANKQKEFLGNYIDGLQKQQQNNNNSYNIPNGETFSGLSNEAMVELLYDEMQACLMACNFLWAVWAINSALTSKIQFGYWDMAQSKYDCYLLTKGHYEQRQKQQRQGDKIKIELSKM